MNYRFNKQVNIMMQQAQKEAKDMGNNYVGSEHILLAIMSDSSATLSKRLAKHGVYYDQLKEDLMILFGLKDKDIQNISLTQVVEDMLQRAMILALARKQKDIDSDILTCALLQSENCVASEILNRYDLDVNELLKQLNPETCHELDKFNELRNLNNSQNNEAIVGRDKEIDLMISILSRKEKANPLLIGEPGVGKTAIVEKLANMIVHHEVPGKLNDAIIYELHLNTLVAGTKYRGDFEEKLQNLIKALKKYPNVILFVDEIHQMIGAGKSEGSIDVSSVLKPYLARGEIKCIGATTIDEYEKFIEKDRALERRFQVVRIKEPTKQITTTMLQAKLSEYSKFHNVEIASSLVEEIVDYCDYFMPNRKFPDKAIDVLDLACVFTKRNKQQQVNRKMVKDVIEQLTDIPISSKNRILYLQSILSERVIHQEEVIEKLMKQVTWIEQGVLSSRPLGVWLFLGNQGVGKTTLIQQFNLAYFNQEDIIEWDVSSPISLKNSLNKLKRNPYTIFSILNIQEANPSVIQSLKLAIEKGFVETEDSKIDLRHCIMIVQGEFAYKANSSLRFNEKNGWIDHVTKGLGHDVMNMFDEIFIFNELKIEHKQLVMKQILQSWHQEMEDEVICKAISSSTSLHEATKKLKYKIAIV
ncbi:MAG: AAA family ATPase [Erysipelotrichaceae bacterium]